MEEKRRFDRGTLLLLVHVAVIAAIVIYLVNCGDDTATVHDAAGDARADGATIDAAIDAAPRTWEQIYVKSSNAMPGDIFGFSVAISADGNTVVAGAFGEDSVETLSGAAYVFERTGRTWSETGKLKASNAGASDAFGIAVAISADGSTIAVGASDRAVRTGAAYVFVKSGATWTEQKFLVAGGGAQEDRFGSALALSGDGNALFVTGGGRVYPFARSGTAWTAATPIVASNPALGDSFGASLAVSADGNQLAVGAPNEDGPTNQLYDPGAVYRYTRNGSSWTEQIIRANDPTNDGDNFGIRIAMSANGDTLLVGAHHRDALRGTAYLIANGVQTRLDASNRDPDDTYGFVALSGDAAYAVIGAYGEASAAKGFDGDQSDNTAEEAGAAYLFEHGAQLHYVKPSNTFNYAQFGYTTAVANDGTFVVGSHTESGGSQGIGGDQTPNISAQSGALYIYQ